MHQGLAGNIHMPPSPLPPPPSQCQNQCSSRYLLFLQKYVQCSEFTQLFLNILQIERGTGIPITNNRTGKFYPFSENVCSPTNFLFPQSTDGQDIRVQCTFTVQFTFFDPNSYSHIIYLNVVFTLRPKRICCVQLSFMYYYFSLYFCLLFAKLTNLKPLYSMPACPPPPKKENFSVLEVKGEAKASRFRRLTISV